MARPTTNHLWENVGAIGDLPRKTVQSACLVPSSSSLDWLIPAKRDARTGCALANRQNHAINGMVEIIPRDISAEGARTVAAAREVRQNTRKQIRVTSFDWLYPQNLAHGPRLRSGERAITGGMVEIIAGYFRRRCTRCCCSS